MRIRGLDFRCLFAGQGNFGLRLIAMGTAQIIEQFSLILIIQGIVGALFANAGLTQLLEQGHDGHFKFNGKL